MRTAEKPAAALAGSRGCAGDRSLTARLHMRNNGLAEVERATQIDIEHRVIIGGLDLHDLQGLRDAGVIDQNINMAEMIDDLINTAAASIAVGNIASDPKVPISQRICSLYRQFFITIKNCHTASMLSKKTSRCQSDPFFACCTGYYCYFIF